MRPWRSRILVGLTSFAFAATGFTAPANATDTSLPEDAWQTAAESTSATPVELAAEVADGSLKLVVVRDVNGLPVIETAYLKSMVDLEEMLAEIKKDSSVISVEPESQVTTFSTPPYFSSQWGMDTVAVESVSATTQGAGVVVAVIDSGVDASNPDLVGRVIDGVDYRDGFSYLSSSNLIDNCVSYTDADYSGTGRTKPVHADLGKYDPNGHGTHVAGIITSNGIGIKSVAPQATVMPVRVLSSSGSGDISDVACGILYAANNGAQVINMSLGTDEDSPALRAAVAYAISMDVVVVAATGNEGTTGISSYPADLPGVIGVGAISSSAENPIAYFSNKGSFVDVVAPGIDIWSTCSSSSSICSTTDGDSNYESLSGTSMATPFVAGLAALILSMDTSLKNSDVADIITSSAVDKGQVGVDQVYGYGVINAAYAIQKTQEFRQVVAARLAEVARLANEKAVADKLAADQKVIADKAAALSKIAKSLNIKVLTNHRISISVTAPIGSKTVIQRKVGGIWKTLSTTSAVKSKIVKVANHGYYRIQIKSTKGTVTSKIYRVK